MTKITTEYCDFTNQYVTTDENYDGAPDAGTQNVGFGKTKEESLADYHASAEENKNN